MTTLQLTIDPSPSPIHNSLFTIDHSQFPPPLPPSWGWEDFSNESTPNLQAQLNRIEIGYDGSTGWIGQHLRRHQIERELARRGVAG